MESRVRDLRQQLFEFDKHQNLSKNDFFVSDSNFSLPKVAIILNEVKPPLIVVSLDTFSKFIKSI